MRGHNSPHRTNRGKIIKSLRLTFFSALLALSSVFGVALTPSPSQALTTGGEWEQVSSGGNVTCAISSQDELYCRGNNSFGQLGDGTNTGEFYKFKKVRGALAAKAVTEVSVGEYSVCAVADSQAYCWGGNSDGQLGDGTIDSRYDPTKVGGLLEGKSVSKIGSSYDHTCAIADGRAYCWGRNTIGQLGDNSFTDSYVPVAVDTSGVLNGKQLQSVSGMSDSTCVTSSDGTVFCWGNNGQGQLGNNSSVNSETPVQVDDSDVLSGVRIVEVSSGNQQTCARSDVGRAYCWGTNIYGELGNGGNSPSPYPSEVSNLGPAYGKLVTSISVGANYGCAVANSTSYCWGRNVEGQLGDNTQTDSNVPVAGQYSSIPNLSKVSSGSAHSCALGAGQIYCWGSNPYGAVGYKPHSYYLSLKPLAINEGNTTAISGASITDMKASYAQTCVLANASVYCWGDNYSGVLGNGTSGNQQQLPAKVGGLLNNKVVSALSAGFYHTCALSGGDAYCWGSNQYGELGDGTTTNAFLPVKVGGVLTGKTITKIVAGGHFTCAVADGQLYCWGRNDVAQVGDGSQDTVFNPELIAGLPNGAINSLDAGVASACAAVDGTAYCWGDNWYGHMGIEGGSAIVLSPTAISAKPGVLAGKYVSDLRVGERSSCLLAEGRAYCSGSNHYGELGDGGAEASSDVPVAVGGELATQAVTDIHLGDEDACALAQGEVYCWGYGYNYGQLGTGMEETYRNVPVKVMQEPGILGGKTVTHLAVGYYYVCAVASNQVYCWGDNGYLQLGVKYDEYSTVPVITDHTFPSFSGSNGNTISDTSHPTISKRPTFSGTAEPGSAVVVTVHSDPVTCTTTADSNGNWSCTLPSDLPPGSHTVLVEVTQNGDTTTFGPYAVTVASSPTTLGGNTSKPKSVKQTTVATTAGASDVATTGTPVSDEIDQNTSGDSPVSQPNESGKKATTKSQPATPNMSLTPFVLGGGALLFAGVTAFLGIRRLRSV